MDIVNINEAKPVKCIHCHGRGICSHATYTTVTNNGHPAGSMWCPKCGYGAMYNGSIGPMGGHHYPAERNNMQRPVCTVCGGKGQVLIT